MIQLRPYQVHSIAAVRDAIRSGKRRIMLTIPTGGGKTYTAASIIAGAVHKGKRSLFVAHRLELIDQTVASFHRLGLDCVGVIRANDKRRDAVQPIQVASIQTLARREQQAVDLIIIDEAHRGTAKSYVDHLFDRHPKAVIIGLSATPVRADGHPLGSHFDELVVGAKYSDLIDGGSIVAPIVYSTPIVADLSKVRTSGGDYNVQDLEAAMNKGVLVGDLVEQWLKRPRQRTVAFAVSIAHSRAIVARFTGVGVAAEHLDGTTPEDERRAILARLASGETTVVSNVGVLTEGWDLPACKTMILARPTKSLGLYMQMAGRILRPFEGVTPIINDHGCNVDRHGLPHVDREWSLSKQKKKKNEAPPVKACPACFAFVLIGKATCPHCGHEFDAKSVDEERKRDEPIPVDLVIRTLNGDDAKLASFKRLYDDCRARGWRYTAIVHRYWAKWNEAPPDEWVSALASDYRRDTEWKERIKVATARRKAREEQAA
jgi:superfamily II DNA or RNA helicase